jgi:hypothetical protein
MSTKSFTTMPEALLLTSTWVMGWIFPVATTERATSARVTLAMRLASMTVPRASLTSATAAMTTTINIPMPTQIQKLLFLRDAATPSSSSV